MRRLLLLPVFLLAACGGGASGIDSIDATAEESRSVLLGERQLVLDGFAGDVSLIAVGGLREVEVTFTKHARGSSDRQAEGRLPAISIREAGDDALYQFVWRTDLQTEARVDAVVRVPFGTDVVVRLGAGEVTANGLRGPLDAETGAGDIRVDHVRSPNLKLKTGSGNVTSGGAFIPGEGIWNIETGAGRVTLLLPASASARVEAESSAGSLDLDPELPFSSVRQQGGPAGIDFRAELGQGQAQVRATTGAGDIEILRYKEPVPESEAARATAPARRDTLRRPKADTTGGPASSLQMPAR